MSQPARRENPASALRHCLLDLPYRAVVLHSINQHGVPLYLVAGSAAPPCSAVKALRAAATLHPSKCYYCKDVLETPTIDHVEAIANGGDDAIQNLVVSCLKCNQTKARTPILAFKPEAGRDWLLALQQQIQERLVLLTPPSPPQPKPAATTDP